MAVALALVLALLAVALGPAAPVRAATLTVVNGDDSGAGSLRQAIADASVEDTIVFASGVTTVTLTSDQLAIGKDLTIQGGGVVTVRRDAVANFRIFEIDAATVQLQGLLLTNGAAPNIGGALFNNGGTVTLSGTTVSGSTTRFGGGISNNNGATLTLIGSTISGNTASGGSIFDGNGGGLSIGPGTATLINSTVSGNTAANAGGGVYNSTATVTLRFVTLVGNSAANQGGGLANVGVSGSPASAIVGRSLLSGNTSPDGVDCHTNDATFGPVTSEGYNVVGASAGCPSDGPGDLAHGGALAALLNPTLAANGGPTQTHALPLGSPALDRVPTGQCAAAAGADQRGIVRPQGAACDSGAVELAFATLTTSPPLVATLYSPGTVVTLTPQPGSGQTFVGWLVDGAAAGWATSLTITMNADHSVQTLLAPTVTFFDVPPGRADFAAIRELASRGTIRGYSASSYGPDDGVALGYQPADCAAKGRTFPCYGPSDPVTSAETITFITRAMVAKGYWVLQPNAPQPHAGVPAVFAPFVATFQFYTAGTGGVPAPPANWSAGATRGWFARALWAALDAYWATDGTLPDGRPAGGFAP